MPVATVKSHLQRSLALLREKVTRTMGEVTI
jgi:DNA-directed RNA polymerase specialized sigma24 family protein